MALSRQKLKEFPCSVNDARMGGYIAGKEGKGTLKYEGKWNFYDQIVLSGNMLSDERSTLKFYNVEVFSRDYLFQHKGRFKGSIKRTHAAGVWLNGYSDHLPVIVHLLKKAR